jgi:hypothetical protein
MQMPLLIYSKQAPTMGENIDISSSATLICAKYADLHQKQETRSKVGRAAAREI